MSDIAVGGEIICKGEMASVRRLEAGQNQPEQRIEHETCKDRDQREPQQQAGIEATKSSHACRRMTPGQSHAHVAVLSSDTERVPPLLDHLGYAFRDLLHGRADDLPLL